mmetsp:Transcript_13197/g.23942  ORF Transcript_13197/g.23942 Transcript_13197/m.23942 type:complete len:951 (-) Transcript_13197:32-2884(-)
MVRRKQRRKRSSAPLDHAAILQVEQLNEILSLLNGVRLLGPGFVNVLAAVAVAATGDESIHIRVEEEALNLAEQTSALRQRLATHILHLASVFTKHQQQQQQQQQSERTAGDNNDDAVLLALEEVCANVRCDIADYRASLVSQRQSIISCECTLKRLCLCYQSSSQHHTQQSQSSPLISKHYDVSLITNEGLQLCRDYKRQMVLDVKQLDQVEKDCLAQLYLHPHDNHNSLTGASNSSYDAPAWNHDADHLTQTLQTCAKTLRDMPLLHGPLWDPPPIQNQLGLVTSPVMIKMDQPNVNFSTDPDNDLTESSHPTQAHEIKMPLSSTLQHTVHAFLMASHPTLPSAATFVLLLGTSGSGKTHLLRTIQDQASSKEDVTVIYPTLPTDLTGSTVGASEDRLLSLFSYAKAVPTSKCILILDGMEHLLGDSFGQAELGASGSDDNPAETAGDHKDETHAIVRLRSTFLSIMDHVRHNSSNHANSNIGTSSLLVVCSGAGNENGLTERFDQVFSLSSPDFSERKKILTSFLGLADGISSPEETILLDDISMCTVGRSRAELTQLCRKSIDYSIDRSFHINNADTVIKGSKVPSRLALLERMKYLIQSIEPESIRGGSLDGVVDMRVLTRKELLGPYRNVDQPLELPLFGTAAYNAWHLIDSLIVAPLCRYKALDTLMYGGDYLGRSNNNGKSLGQKTVCAGVLLHGSAGVGKTALAYHCAAEASRIVPSMRLLDVSCTSLIHKEVGGSERALQKLFTAARAAAPCILLMDGIETLAPVRGNDNTTEGTMDRILSTLLTEMDGIDEYGSDGVRSCSENTEKGRIAVIGITHDPSWIDPALLRAGRFEKCICLEHPDIIARMALVRKYTENIPVDFSSAGFFEPKDRNSLVEFLAMQTGGMSAAEVIAICSEASMACLTECIHNNISNGEKDTIPEVQHKHFLSALHFRQTGTLL